MESSGDEPDADTSHRTDQGDIVDGRLAKLKRSGKHDDDEK